MFINLIFLNNSNFTAGISSFSKAKNLGIICYATICLFKPDARCNKVEAIATDKNKNCELIVMYQLLNFLKQVVFSQLYPMDQ